MALPSVYNAQDVATILSRIQKLTPETQPQWGKMNVGQMLAHCNVTYEMMFESKHKAPSSMMKMMLKWMVKPMVVSDKPYKQNTRTAPAFLITDQREFRKEKERLESYINRVVDLGPTYFNGKESLSFGPLTTQEWNNLMYKHLDHHLTQFGV